LRTGATTQRARLPYEEQALLGTLGLRMSRENLNNGHGPPNPGSNP